MSLGETSKEVAQVYGDTYLLNLEILLVVVEIGKV
jgi:hypothetical protein